MAQYELFHNVHVTLPPPPVPNVNNQIVSVRGDYEYWHYGCDGFDDRGFGCGYRTLQTICSWLTKFKPESKVPSLPDIQKILVNLEDKPASFIGSRDWIGSFEVCLVIDQLFGIPSKIIHITSGKEVKNHVPTLKAHFANFGSPVMMGGDEDASSKGIFGIATSTTEAGDNKDYLLVLDPHYYGSPLKDCTKLFRDNWVYWKPLEDLLDSSFYNLCLPQISPPDGSSGAKTNFVLK